MPNSAHNQESCRDDYPLRRRTQPRLGSFVTIAVALLMLFGAASRMGKLPETSALLGLDSQAEKRLKLESERLQGAIIVGTIPVSAGEQRPQPAGMYVNPNPLPPLRTDVDVDALRRQQTRPSGPTLPLPVELWNNEATGYPVQNQQGQPGGVRPPASSTQNSPPALSQRRETSPESYTVADGDTWSKIAARTLGDSKRWQELMTANPEASGGLRVGMKLVVPK